MLRLSEILGAAVSVGTRSGRLAELFADPAHEHPSVTAVAVRRRGGAAEAYGWRDLEEVGSPGWVVRAGAEPATPAPGLLRLADQVMDLQIVDLVGKRVSRVGDVLLAREGRDLSVSAVEVGAAPVLRRLGLSALARRLPEPVLAWRDLHPASGRAHALMLDSPAARVHELSADEVAELLGNLPPTRGAELVSALEPRHAADALARAQEDHAARVAAALPDPDRERVARHLGHAERARLARAAPRAPRRFRHVLRSRRAPS